MLIRVSLMDFEWMESYRKGHIYIYVYMFACMNLDNLLTRGGCNFLKKILLFLIFFFFVALSLWCFVSEKDKKRVF